MQSVRVETRIAIGYTFKRSAVAIVEENTAVIMHRTYLYIV